MLDAAHIVGAALLMAIGYVFGLRRGRRTSAAVVHKKVADAFERADFVADIDSDGRLEVAAVLRDRHHVAAHRWTAVDTWQLFRRFAASRRLAGRAAGDDDGAA